MDCNDVQMWLDDFHLLDRENGPALIYPDGTEQWWKSGMLHRLDGPAVRERWYHDSSSCSMTQEWFVKGKCHRIDGPAVAFPDGSEEWWIEGKRHRIDGRQSFIRTILRNGSYG